MSKITFRADDDLVERLEAFDASKSEVMREALRTYLDDAEREESGDDGVGRLEALLAEHAFAPRDPPDINVNVTIDGETATPSDVSVDRGAEPSARKTDREEPRGQSQSRNTCSQCGETLSSGHVYCPNCGEKGTRRVFCDCGDEIRSDWAFCPGCGRRTPAADVLDKS
ncbi:Double zinc ribbon [Haloplanus vescus]|uniref:Double zinc ribbon n=1 Tax=Haloplanus vescus TaxID=555874 RepID=A0A1H3WX96_9EURY|nr:zinc ribbon domain-containing protein [Haloplanus vescus]SDZ91786.1 Double zinc ribbon [Haloplanus vescus]